MPTIPPANEELPSHSVPCPSCGVPVAVGYPRCPKCKAAVPAAPRARRGSVREQLLSGGTSIEPPSSAGGGAWLPWVLVALVIVGIGAFLAFRGGGAKSSTGVAPAKVVDDDDDDTDETDDTDDTDDGDDAPTRRDRGSASVEQGDPMVEAASALDEDLRGERLWAKVTHDGTTLEIESSLCPQIEEQLADLARRAYGLGARRVECHTKNGETIFDRAL